MSRFAALFAGRPAQRWLVTGAAGFIGSNLTEALLGAGQQVVGLDNFSTGSRRNLDDVRRAVGESAWSRFVFLEGDVQDPELCALATANTDIVLHQAALGSVPRSIATPMKSFGSNVVGFATLITAAKDAGLRRFVYASSSSVYGDHPALPKVEHVTGNPLSPYAATKAIDELWAATYARSYGLSCVGLRYFNVFGPRQDPDGAYAAVIPRWIGAMLRGEPVWINGDGQTSRDFCFVDNAVQANIRAGLATDLASPHEVFNVAAGQRTTLLEMFAAISESLTSAGGLNSKVEPILRDFREGDVRHSLADISKARTMLGYQPTHDVLTGLQASVDWYVRHLPGQRAGAA
jgi:UDP-N-acetylglucosamine 4-epimerase